METGTRKKLATVAKEQALLPFHGRIDGKESNLNPIVGYFPTWSLKEADGLWCAAFVYHCCREAGFEFPYRPKECVRCHLAGCPGWEDLAIAHPRIEYHQAADDFDPEPGDIVLYDRVFNGREHDHIGIVLECRENELLAAEGNYHNESSLVTRPRDEHIRGFIRIPDGFRYSEETSD